MNRQMRFPALVAAAILTVSVLATAAGCSDGAEEQDVIEGPETTSTTSTSSGGDQDDGSQLVAPVIVDSAEPVSLPVGGYIDVVSEGVESVRSSDEAVLEVSQPNDDGSATFNAGAEAVATGEATLTVNGADGVLYEVAVTVTD